MQHCNLVISGSSRARNNNVDGFMRHGRTNDNHLPSNYIALQGQQHCVGNLESKNFKATVQLHETGTAESTNMDVICCNLYNSDFFLSVINAGKSMS